MLSLCLRHCSNALKKTSLNFVPRRNFISYFFPKKSEQSYRIKDGINDSFVMIYKAPMENYIPFCNLITTVSVVFLGGYLIYRFRVRNDTIENVPKQMEVFNTGTVIMADDEIIYAIIGMVVLCLGMKMVVWKYPLRIYKNSNDYISIFEGGIPYTRSKHNFMKGEVKEIVPNKITENILPWSDSQYSLKNRTAILLYPNFRTPADLHHMLQPIKQVKPKAKK